MIIVSKGHTTDSVKTASLITAASKYVTVIFSLVFTMVLARLISPDEFGIVAIAVVFTSFFSIFSDMGLSSGVIQNKGLSAEDINNIYSFNCYISIVLAIVFFLFSFALAWFYEDSVYVPLGAVLAVSLFFSSMIAIPQALFMRMKRFALMGITRVVSSVLGGCIAVVLAYHGFGCFAIGFQSLLTALVQFIWVYLLARAECGLRFSLVPGLGSIRKIFDYSAYIFGFNAINYFARNLDNLLIGKALGAQALGYYDKAYKLITFPVQNLTTVISSALHPILSEFQQNFVLIYRRYIPIVKFLSLTGVFLSVVFFFSGDELVLLMFGDGWSDSIAPFKMLCLSLWFQMTASSCGGIYLSLGKTNIALRSCCVFVPIQVICIIIGVATGSLEYCALLVSISFITKFFVEYWFLIKRSFGASFFGFLKLFLPDALIAFLMSVVMLFVCQIGLIPDNAILSILVKLGVGFLAFITCAQLTRQSKYIIALLPRKIADKMMRILGVH